MVNVFDNAALLVINFLDGAISAFLLKHHATILRISGILAALVCRFYYLAHWPCCYGNTLRCVTVNADVRGWFAEWRRFHAIRDTEKMAVCSDVPNLSQLPPLSKSTASDEILIVLLRA